MAKWSFLVIAIASLAVGCQSQQSADNLPQPNFNGPVIAAAPVVIPRAAPVAPPVAAAPAPKAVTAFVGNVPRDWIPKAGFKRDWYWIVIHHSATPSGSERDFDREHKEKGWDECGYHFVIGNGTNSGNGQVEVSGRWPVQKYGAHAYTPDERFNQHGIGICLVGNFDIDRPTAAQMASLNKLVTYLMRTYNIPPSRVLGHRETKQTDCPGRNLNLNVIRRSLQQQLADAGVTIPDDMQPMTASSELLYDDATADAAIGLDSPKDSN
jgi:hypothetical protein